ncbi:MAG: prepilin-type N-terminal cleavage/methylation domain-containing protein, partial [Verrucomicrobiaceae bacterium]
MGLTFHPQNRRAFTIMELMTVLVIISILMVLLLKVTDSVKARAEKGSCISNLKNLY